MRRSWRRKKDLISRPFSKAFFFHGSNSKRHIRDTFNQFFKKDLPLILPQETSYNLSYLGTYLKSQPQLPVIDISEP